MATKSAAKKRRKRGPAAWLRRQLRAEPKPLWMVLAAHVLALGIALVLYALPHHVIPHGEAVMGVVSSRGVEATPVEAPVQDDAGEGEEPLEAAEESEEEVGEALEDGVPEAEAEDAEPTTQAGVVLDGSFRASFPDAFTTGEVERSKHSYRSANLNITIQNRYVDEIRARVYVADIRVADISCLTTAFSKEKYGRGYTEWITRVAKRYESVVTINGDYYGSRGTGVIIRNGKLYRDKKYKGDIAVLYWDGHMEMISSSDFDTMQEMGKGAYQSWSFGPSLLDGFGNPLQSFNCSRNLQKKNPRSAIGYFEPGHYCFVAVDGRNKESRGASMEELAKLMSQLGCRLAYNLDGGQTSLLGAGSDLINKPSQGGRSSSDYIMVVDKISP